MDVDEQIRVDIRENDLIKRLIRLLASRSVPVQARAAGCMMNLALSEENKDEIRGLDGIKPLIALLGSRQREVQSPAAGALANLAAYSTPRSHTGTARFLVSCALTAFVRRR